MYTIQDYEEERQRMKDNTEFFFNEFSSEIRNKLMSKNLSKINSLYDVYYPTIAKDLLAKNAHFSLDLDEFSKEIRNNQLLKSIEKTFSLEENSEEFKKSLMTRNQLHKNTLDLADSFERKRKDLLSKNAFSLVDIMKLSESYRIKNISKNVSNFNKDNDNNQEKYKEQNLTHNIPQKNDLEINSIIFKDNELKNNVIKNDNLEIDSEKYKNFELSKNIKNENELKILSEDFKQSNLTKNLSNEFGLEFHSKEFKNNNLKNNNLKNNLFNKHNLEKESANAKNDNLNKNTIIDTKNEVNSDVFKKNNLNSNISKVTDLEVDSILHRNSELSLNNKKINDLQDNSTLYRDANLASNIQDNSDLEKESLQVKNDNLLKNKGEATSLEAISEEFIKNNLVKDKQKESNLVGDSNTYIKNNLSKNNEVISDIDIFSKTHRDNNLMVNVSAKSDLEHNSNEYKANNLSTNKLNEINIETNSVSFLQDSLSSTVSKSTNLGVDSMPYKNLNLSTNVFKKTDLEKESTLYRDDDLSTNVPKKTDLEKESALYKDDDLSTNVPKKTDLEKESVLYRSDDLVTNVPKITNLEIDSVSYREGDLVTNISKITDLETDSVSHREGDLAANAPNVTDLETDSVSHREGDLVTNVPKITDLETDSASYREGDLSVNNNKPQTIDSHTNLYGQANSSDEEKENNLRKNIPVKQTIDSYKNALTDNLNRNIGFGQLGFNVLGPGGTSTFIGVSGVFAQGFVFKNLLTMQNKYNLNSSYTEDKNLAYGQGGMLLANTINVPFEKDILSKKALPMTPAEVINLSVKKYSELTSPIERNLKLAYQSAKDCSEKQKYYSITNKETPIKNYNIDYNLENSKTIGKSFNFKETINLDFPSDNINNLMRQYLKYSNPFSLNEEGKLNKEGSKNNIESIYEKIISIGKIKNNESIRDLITSYNFLKRQSPKSLVAPDGVYLTGDVEKMYDTNYGNDDNENIAATTVLGNPTHYGFNDGRAGSPDKGKGVRSILRRIGNSKIEASGNFKDIQGKEHENKVFVVGGDKAGDSKKLYQTYTVKNPYAPQMAGKLIFSLTNYSIPATQGRTMYFPPYISSFQNSDSANWNAINFLGRPEAVYTYNYSSRGGSISFFVLTDYAETIVIGRKQSETMDVISRNIKKNFTVSDLGSSESTKFLIKKN